MSKWDHKKPTLPVNPIPATHRECIRVMGPTGNPTDLSKNTYLRIWGSELIIKSFDMAQGVACFDVPAGSSGVGCSIYVSCKGSKVTKIDAVTHLYDAPKDDILHEIMLVSNIIQLEPEVIVFPSGAKKRDALPGNAFDKNNSCITLGSFDRDLIYPIPAGADRRYFRAQFCGMRVDGLPFLPGLSSSQRPDCVFTPFLGKYSEYWQDKILDRAREEGQTHFHLGRPDISDLGNISILNSYVALTKKVVAAGIPYPCHNLLSKEDCPRDADVGFYRNVFQNYIPALKDVGCEISATGWELDLFNISDPDHPNANQLHDIIKFLSDSLPGVDLYNHFSPEKTWWGKTRELPDRFAFWHSMAGRVIGLWYQCDPNWDIREMQARYVDTLSAFADGRMGQFAPGQDFIFVSHEVLANDLYFSPNEHPNEDDADLIGNLLLCTRGGVAVSGNSNGQRRKDGMWI